MSDNKQAYLDKYIRARKADDKNSQLVILPLLISEQGKSVVEAKTEYQTAKLHAKTQEAVCGIELKDKNSKMPVKEVEMRVDADERVIAAREAVITAQGTYEAENLELQKYDDLFTSLRKELSIETEKIRQGIL